MKPIQKFLLTITLTLISYLGMADPPVPSSPVTCPALGTTVRCFVIDSVVCVGLNSVDIYFTTFNWFSTLIDNGVDELRIIPTFPSKQQVTMVQASAPVGWTVFSFSNDSVIFKVAPPTAGIPDSSVCASCTALPPGNCGNNKQGGFRIMVGNIDPLDCFTANWRHYSQGVDNGDVMNFGALSWCVGQCPVFCSNSLPCNVVATYGTTPFPPSLFVPTLSQWALFILCLLTLALGVVFVSKRQHSLVSPAGTFVKNLSEQRMPFSRELFLKTYLKVLGFGILVLVLYYAYSAQISYIDTFGVVLSTAIIAYIIHYLSLLRNR